jgi:hypothetical protein
MERGAASARMAMQDAVERSERMVDFNTDAVKAVSKSESYITSAGARVRKYLKSMFQAKQRALEDVARISMQAQQAQDMAEQAEQDQQRAAEYSQEAKEAASNAQMAGSTKDYAHLAKADLDGKIAGADVGVDTVGAAGVIVPVSGVTHPATAVIGKSTDVGDTPLTDAKELVDTVCCFAVLFVRTYVHECACVNACIE